jgi:APA family basic amino acid/polyamine antiporter
VNEETSSAEPAHLRRTIGPTQLAFYALGSMLGAGIYGLIGQAAGHAGNAVWLSFLVAMVAALLTAFTYASLGSRYPRAGGAAYVVERAFRSPLLGYLTGLVVVCSGITSVATQAQVFSRNIAALLDFDTSAVPMIAAGFLLILAGIVFRGIRESMWVNILCTIVEATGLLIVIGTGFAWLGKVDYLEIPVSADDTSGSVFLLVVLQGSVLAFFAFIGFEDTINVAEECRDPQRTVPFGILVAMIAATILYMAVAITAVSAVPWQDLAKAPSPLTEVIRVTAPAIPPIVFTAITLFAVSNTALVNYVTSSRLLYGMAEQGLLPAVVGRVHRVNRTPHIAVVILLVLLAPLALLGTVGQLASAAVLLLLLVFALMNAALVILQRRADEHRGAFEIHPAVPVCGALICTALILQRIVNGNWVAPTLAAAMVAVILLTYFVVHGKSARRTVP